MHTDYFQPYPIINVELDPVASAQLALAGVKSAISPDDVIDSMRRIGNEMPASLKETGKGGLAITESAKKLCDCTTGGFRFGA